MCYAWNVRTISQRQLRNDSGRIMRTLDQGRSFVITRNGVTVGELTPVRRRAFVAAEAVAAAFAGAPRIQFRRFRRQVDALVDQNPRPRG